MFGSHDRHRKWLLKSGTAATAEIIEVRGQLTETHHGQDVTVWQLRLWVDAVTGEPFEADIADEWRDPSRNFPQNGMRAGVLYDPSDHSRVCLSGVPVPDRPAARAQRAVNVQAFGAGVFDGAVFDGAVNMDLSALSALNLGGVASAASFAELGQLAKQLHEGALTRDEFDAEVRKLFGR
jgi:hypothetical protein